MGAVQEGSRSRQWVVMVPAAAQGLREVERRVVATAPDTGGL